MKMQVRAVLILIAALAIMGLSGCGHYNCGSGANFGSDSCTPSGSGLGGGGTGGTSSGTVFSYLVVEGGGVGMVADSLDLSTNTFEEAPGFVVPPLPQTNVFSGGTVVVNQKFLYIPFTDGTVYGFVIDGTSGALTAVPNNPYIAGTSGGTSITSDPAGRFLFVSDAVTGNIASFTISSTDGSLTSAGPPFPAGILPAQITTDGQGKFLYASEGASGTEVAALAINQSTGALSAVTNSPFLFPMSMVVGENSGKYILGVTGQTAAIHVFAINSQTGAIAEVTNSPFTTASVVGSLVVHPTGVFVYTVDGFSNPIEGYSFNTSTGALAALGSSPFVGINLNAAEFDQSGLFLFGASEGSVSFAYGPYAVDTASGLISAPAFGLLGYPGSHFAVSDLTVAP